MSIYAYMYAGRSAHPLPVLLLLGKGVDRMRALSLNAAQGDMLRTDEIAHALHRSVQKGVLAAVNDMVQKCDAQIRAPTRGSERAFTAHRTLRENDKDSFAFCRLDEKEDAPVQRTWQTDDAFTTAINFRLAIR